MKRTKKKKKLHVLFGHVLLLKALSGFVNCYQTTVTTSKHLRHVVTKQLNSFSIVEIFDKALRQKFYRQKSYFLTKSQTEP